MKSDNKCYMLQLTLASKLEIFSVGKLNFLLVLILQYAQKFIYVISNGFFFCLLWCSLRGAELKFYEELACSSL